jgi:hypothetical protein
MNQKEIKALVDTHFGGAKFEVHKDGIILYGDVTYQDRRPRVRNELRGLPIKVYEIHGGFCCNFANLDNFVNFPPIILGDFSAKSNYFRSLAGMPLVMGSIMLRNNKLLSSIKGVQSPVAKFLDVSCCSIVSLADVQDLVINGHLYCSNNALSSTKAGITVTGDADFTGNKIINEALGIVVMGAVNLSENPATADDDNLKERATWS